MASFKKLEMAPALSMREDIEVKKGFLGLSQKVFYRPTGSPVDVVQTYYGTDQGARIRRVLEAPVGEVAEAVKSAGVLTGSGTGPVRIDACLSQDGRFAAVQLFGYADLLYHPQTEVRILRDDEAVALRRWLM